MPVLDPLTPDRLAAVADLADARLAAMPEEGSSLVRVRLLPDEVELGWLPLRGAHPLDLLVGERAPADWAAIGVAVTGRAHHLDGDHADAVPVRSVHLVGRDGSWAFRYSPREGDGRLAGSAACGAATDPGRPVGRIDDACRLALGAGTAPPTGDTGTLWALQWLDAVVRAAGLGPPGSLRRWGDVAALHPAVAALRPDEPGDLPLVDLVALAGQLAAWRDWPVLRRSCAAGTWASAHVDPGLAAWLDDGAFSRWLLGAYPDLDDLLAAVAAAVPDDVAEAVAAVVETCADGQAVWP